MFVPNDSWIANLFEQYRYQKLFKTAKPYEEEDCEIIDGLLLIEAILSEKEEQLFHLNNPGVH